MEVMMTESQDSAWAQFEDEMVKEVMHSRKAFDHGWFSAANEAIDYLNRMGHFGLAGMVCDLLYGEWVDEEEVDE
jgi:hypothetical protein